jgi:Na+/H+ antiporter NhaC
MRRGYEVSEGQPFTLFLSSIPYNFYCWFTLLLLALVIWRDWNIGPMRQGRAESRNPVQERSDGKAHVCPPRQHPVWPQLWYHWWSLLGGLFVGLYWDGTGGRCFH